jgi:hypothetical protein
MYPALFIDGNILYVYERRDQQILLATRPKSHNLSELMPMFALEICEDEECRPSVVDS